MRNRMKYMHLGATNLRVSRVSLGALCFGDPGWRPYVVDEAASAAIMRRAFELGVNLVDTSDYYSAGRSEEIVGRAVAEMMPRNEVIIATKVGNPMADAPNSGGYSRRHILAAAEASLRRLRTDYIDIYQTHIWDPATDLEEMVAAFDDLVRQGKVRHVGVTVMPTWQLVSAIGVAERAGRTAFRTVSNHYNLLWREDEHELLPFCASAGMGVIAHSPHARGRLCGRARREGATATVRAATDEYADRCYGQAADFALADLVEQLASARGIKPAQFALAWVLSRPAIHSALIGATRPEHVDDAVVALDIELAAEDVARAEAAYSWRQPGSLWT